MSEEPTQPTTVHLPSGGSIPGIPGEHGPGTYLVDWIKRTIQRVEDAAEAVIEHVEEAVHPASPPPADTTPAPAEPVAEAPTEQTGISPAPSEPAGEAAPVEEQGAN